MSDDPKVLAKVANILLRIPDNEDMIKESSKLSKALKITGLVGASAGTGAMVGSTLGETKGRKKGRQEQLNYDMSRFRTAAKKIYSMGRTHGAMAIVSKIKQRFSSGLKGGNGPSNVHKLPKLNPPTIKKASLDNKAVAVYNAWATGQIPTEHLQNLPPSDMAKVAAVVIDRMDDGDKLAHMLWNLLS